MTNNVRDFAPLIEEFGLRGESRILVCCSRTTRHFRVPMLAWRSSFGRCSHWHAAPPTTTSQKAASSYLRAELDRANYLCVGVGVFPRGTLVGSTSQMMSAETQRRDPDVVAPELS